MIMVSVVHSKFLSFQSRRLLKLYKSSTDAVGNKKNPYRCHFAVVLTAAKASSKIPALLLECAR